jgi:anti-sigma factor (TIGR02949 family)
MTLTTFGEHACRKTLARLDSYLDNELLTESNLDLLEHFRRCTACTREADARRAVRTRLKTAVREVRAPAGLEDRVRERLRGTRRPATTHFNLMGIAAALAVCFGSWVAIRSAAVHRPVITQEAYFANLSTRVATILRVGLGDHFHCALIRQRLKPVAGTVEKLPAALKPLLPIVREHVPPELLLSVAHECRYQGRGFVHLTFKNDRNVLSLVIARKQDGEALRMADLLPALSQSGIPMYAAGADRYQVAAFESSEYLVYTVSDLSREANLDVLASLAPAVNAWLDRNGE